MRARGQLRVAIVGATGAVGQEVLRLLEDRAFPCVSVELLASANSAGKTFAFRGKHLVVQELTGESFFGVDIAIFSAGSEVSRQFAPIANEAGCVVIDNSSAFRMHPLVPLVVPEINGYAAFEHKGIIANPNCTTAITLMALYPLHKAFGVEWIMAASYQAVSGAGAKGVAQLRHELTYPSAVRDDHSVFPHPIAHNVIPQVGSFLSSGYTDEEKKLQNEARKIMGLPRFKASATCVRVPVYRAHSVAVWAKFVRPIDLGLVFKVLRQAPGVQVFDDPSCSAYPTPLMATGLNDCLVGRIRKVDEFENGLTFFVAGDQLLKGAALNAVQIAELLTSR